MLTRYVLITFGSGEAYYWQVYYCLLGLLRHAPGEREIVVCTDHPEWFAWFGDAIVIDAFSAERLAEWIGPQRFFFRAKTMAMCSAAARSPAADVVVYTDADTIARRDLAPMVEAVAGGAVLMDSREFNCASARSRTKRALWAEVGGKTWGGVPFDGGVDMWNAGFVAFGRRDRGLADEVLKVLDAMLAAGCRHWMIEQAATSAVAAATGRLRELNPAGQPGLVDHYWGNKDGYNQAIAQRLATIFMRRMSVAEAVEFVHRHPVERPLKIRRRWWNKWFVRLAAAHG